MSRTPLRMVSTALAVLSVAYFVWWGCFSAAVPTTDACGGLCCPTCSCCAPNSGNSQAYCSREGQACVTACSPPNSLLNCGCPSTSLRGLCRCNADGVMDECDQVTLCANPGSVEMCSCPTTGISGMCSCRSDGTMDPCAFVNGG